MIANFKTKMCHYEIYVVSLSTRLCHLTVMARERTGRKLLTDLKRKKYFLAFMTPCPCARSLILKAAAGKLLHWLWLSTCVCVPKLLVHRESLQFLVQSILHLFTSLCHWSGGCFLHMMAKLLSCIKEVKLIILLGHFILEWHFVSGIVQLNISPSQLHSYNKLLEFVVKQI